MKLPVDHSESTKQARPPGSLPAASPLQGLYSFTYSCPPGEAGACCQLALSGQSSS